MNFIDTVRLYLNAGSGGNGCLSFRREKYVPRGGPNGGDGGKGGDIYLEADSHLSTFLELSYRPHLRAEGGQNGRGSNWTGRKGKDMTVKVPLGTIIRRGDGILCDLAGEGQKIMVAKGGKSGRGNASFKTNANKAPRIAELGEPGEKCVVDLELKVLADVGLVGLPNAGKSTFLARVSNARPKIADYPFTTLSPNLGLVLHKEKSFVMADIPGLIEGAHEGRGLGYGFLRHVERTRVLVHIVDGSGFAGKPAVENVRVVERELREFGHGLAEKPRIIAVNKMDLPKAKGVFKVMKGAFPEIRVLPVSAVTGKGVGVILDEVVRILARHIRNIYVGGPAGIAILGREQSPTAAEQKETRPAGAARQGGPQPDGGPPLGDRGSPEPSKGGQVPAPSQPSGRSPRTQKRRRCEGRPGTIKAPKARDESPAPAGTAPPAPQVPESPAPARQGYVRMEPMFSVQKLGEGEFSIAGKFVERLAQMTNFDLPEGVGRFHGKLKKIGVDRELRKLHVKPGDIVRISGLEFEWSEDLSGTSTSEE